MPRPPSPPKLLERVKEARARERQAERDLERARRALRDSMRLARDEGVSLAAIGRAAGVTRQRVAQMLTED